MKNIKNIFKKDWKNISSEFTPELQREWEDRGFSYKACKEWIGSGLAVNDADYARWLRDIKGINTGTPYFYILWPNLLNGQLKEEYLFSRLEEERIKLTVQGEARGNPSPFQTYFPNVVTGHPGIDQLIQNSQSDPSISVEILEWAPSNSLEWKNIHLDFVPKLEKAWKELEFSYEQVKEWINIGLKPDEAHFAEWLKFVKNKDAGWFIKNGDIVQLRKEYNQHLKAVNEGIQISVEAFKKIENFSPYWSRLTRELEFSSEQDVLLEELVSSEELRKRIKKYSLCFECKQPNTGRDLYGMRMWCRPCNVEHLKKEFANWTSSNPEIDEFIQNNQLTATSPDKMLKWIPYEQLEIEKDNNGKKRIIGKGGFGKVYLAKWAQGKIKVGWYVGDDNHKDGLREVWEDEPRVALKSLNNSQDITVKFLKEIANTKLVDSSFIAKCHGISQDPHTKDYLMVMPYIRGGDLRQFLKNNYAKLEFQDKLAQIFSIITGLNSIHEKGLIHKDLHPGNILVNIMNNNNFKNMICYITDLGLCRPASEKDESKIFASLPHLAPEILKELFKKDEKSRKVSYTQASDIYSFGIVAYELLANSFPYHDTPYRNWSNDDEIRKELAKKIIKDELRPNLNKVPIPQLLKDLIKKCWDANPEKRITTPELFNTIKNLVNEMIMERKITDFSRQCYNIELEKFYEFKKWLKTEKGREENLNGWDLILSQIEYELINHAYYSRWWGGTENDNYQTIIKQGKIEIEKNRITNYLQVSHISCLLNFSNPPLPQNNPSPTWQTSVSLELRIKTLEEEIKIIRENVNEGQLNLVDEFIELNKRFRKYENNEELESEVWNLEDKLEEKGLSKEKISKIIRHCEDLVKLERQQLEQLNQQLAQVEIPTNR